MVLFLLHHRARFNSIDNYRFQRAFSYAVYAYLHIQDLDEEDRKTELKKKYGQRFLTKLEQVAQETMLVDHRENSQNTRKLLEDCLKGKNGQFSKDIIHEISTFLPTRAQNINI